MKLHRRIVSAHLIAAATPRPERMINATIDSRPEGQFRGPLMLKSTVLALAAVATVAMATAPVRAMPNTGAALRDAADATDMIDKTALYVVGGRRYCFSFDGWHGPGWYRCGFAWRRGLGWGGVYGWRGWDYGPAARRFGHFGGGVTVREGRRFDGGATVRNRSTFRQGTTTTRQSSTVRERSNVREGANIRQRSTASPQTGS